MALINCKQATYEKYSINNNPNKKYDILDKYFVN